MKQFISLLLFFTAFSVYGMGEDRGLYREAESRLEAGDYLLAMDLYKNISQNHPLSAYISDSQFRIAQCSYYLGNFEEALAQLDRVSRRYAGTRYRGMIPLWRGLSLYRLDRFSESAASLLEYLETGSSSHREEALLYKGLADKAMGQYQDARDALEELYGLFKQPGREYYILVLLGDLYLKAKDYDSLSKILEGVDIEDAPASWRDYLLFYTAELIFFTANRTEAEGLYKQLTSAEESLAGASYQRLFSLYQAAGDQEALNFLLKSAEADLRNQPDVLKEFWLRIGIAFFDRDDPGEAEFYLKRVWNSPPLTEVSPLVPLYLSRIAARRGDLAGGIRYITGYLMVSPLERERMLYTLGELQTRMGLWNEAKKTWDEFFRDYPHSSFNTLASYYSGYNAYRLNDYQTALRKIEAVGLAGLTGDQRRSVLRLKARLYGKSENFNASGTAWDDYLAVYPEDYDARGEALKMKFLSGQYRDVLSEALVLKRLDGSRENKALSVLAAYLSGLSRLSLEEWSGTLEDLMPMTRTRLAEAGMEGMYPWVLYYRGWSQYRLSRFDRALKDFSELAELKKPSARPEMIPQGPGGTPLDEPGLEGTPEGELLLSRAAYLAGWCAFQLKDYSSAAGYFLSYSRGPERPDQGRLMYARSLIGGGLHEQAAAVLEGAINDFPNSKTAANTTFELAGLLTLMGRFQEAQDRYLSVYRNSPQSSLAEESLFKRGENYMSRKEWVKAQEAFYECRLAFPRGNLSAAAHYWGGEAAFNAGEVFGAVLLWEKLIAQFSGSPFRPVAMKKTGDVYLSQGDYSRAMAYYTEFSTAYPGEARAVDAATIIETLRFLQRGESEEAAELRAVISTRGGLESPESREAMLELARILLYRGGEDREEGKLLLEDLVFYKNEDLSRAARAQFYLGEYFFRRNEYTFARDAFLAAATMNPEDSDLMAISIFRAAESAVWGGNMRDARILVQRLEDNFPRSSWAEEGRALLEAGQ